MSTALAATPVGVIRMLASASAGVVSVEADLMGGRVAVQIRPAQAPGTALTSSTFESPQRDAIRTIRRIETWADRLTRFATTSELCRLNGHPAEIVEVGPTLAAVLSWGKEASRLSDGIVDPTLLDERLFAEDPTPGLDVRPMTGPRRGNQWAVKTGSRGGRVTRRPGVRFDLGGIAKGWIADRAATTLGAYPSVVVDADGDLAIVLAYGQEWRIGVQDPRQPGGHLAVLQLVGMDPSGSQRLGLATSGTSVHRWSIGGRSGHHLIDPRTRQPARTDVVQATVLADSAGIAEMAAKSIVILGSREGTTLMERPGVQAVIILTDRGDVQASPSALRWLA